MIKYLSPPADVRMADRWFELASTEHFWIQRRFDVLRSLAGDLILASREIAEFGCGNGLVQRQVEVAFDKAVTGFDLNEYALKKNLSEKSPVCCYDVLQMNEELRGKFDLIFLFDVLEHIEDEVGFLKALAFHLAERGKVIVNVPAGMWAYSAYDTAAGHLRRYVGKSLEQAAVRNRWRVRGWTYWGLPLAPTLVLRKVWLMGVRGEDNIIKSGFDPGSKWLNRAMALLSKCEKIPQKLLGTSLMAILEEQRETDDVG
jgi:trans-aconitate methyltransferase